MTVCSKPQLNQIVGVSSARHIIIKTVKDAYTLCTDDSRQRFKMVKLLNKKTMTRNVDNSTRVHE